MNRVFTLKTKTFLTRNLYIKLKCRIIFKYKNNQIMSEEIITQEELKKLTPIKKGELLELKTKEELEKQGFVTTISKAQRWDEDSKRMQILGDNGIDALTRRKIGQYHYNGIVQCKCYASTSTISTEVIAQIDNNIDHWKQERSFGLLVVLTKDSLNQRARNAVLNARNPIFVATLQEIRRGDVQQKLQELKWEDYPGKYLKRTRLEVEVAEELQNIGEIQISAKRIKGLKFEENVMRQ